MKLYYIICIVFALTILLWLIFIFVKKNILEIFWMVNLVKKNIEVRIFPGKMDRNDNGEKIASINKIESNMGIRRFIYNEELEFINNFKKMLIQYGYGDDIKIKVNDSSCSVILDMLRCEYSFWKKQNPAADNKHKET